MKYKVITALQTILLIGLVVATAILDRNKSNWVCGPVLFFAGLILVFFQFILSYITFTTIRQKLKIALMIFSGAILFFYTWGFVSFLTNCS